MTHKMIQRDAEELAGQYHDANRTEVFRANWPDADEYVRLHWRHFIQHVRNTYAELLSKDNVSQDDKDAMYDALIEEGNAARAMNAHEELQVDINGIQGDRSELLRTNRMAVESGEMHRAAKRILNRSIVLPRTVKWT